MTDLALQVADGTTAHAYVARPETPSIAPGLIVFQEAFGVNAHIRDVAGRFAGQGYVVIAPEMFHRTADPGFTGSYDDFESIRPHVQALTTEGIVADARAAHAALATDPAVDPERIAAIGYCMGGRCAFLANTALPLRAAVSYYGGGIEGEALKRANLLSGPQLFFWGGQDRKLSRDYRTRILAELDDSGKDYTNVEISDADHGFFCDARKQFHPGAAADAWALTTEFLRRHLT
jgi:carboxymethylenebutenolidase